MTMDTFLDLAAMAKKNHPHVFLCHRQTEWISGPYLWAMEDVKETRDCRGEAAPAAGAAGACDSRGYSSQLAFLRFVKS